MEECAPHLRARQMLTVVAVVVLAPLLVIKPDELSLDCIFKIDLFTQNIGAKYDLHNQSQELTWLFLGTKVPSINLSQINIRMLPVGLSTKS